MADTLSPADRSIRMSRIKGRDTRPELALRRILHALGLRYRLQVKGLPGTPDLVFPRHKVVVFVHGCFWHRHAGCKIASMPKSNTVFWTEKFAKNVTRDASTTSSLEQLGWRVLIVWECEVSNPGKAQATGEKLASLIRQAR